MPTVPPGQFPAGLAATLRPILATLSDEMITAIAREVPAYARPLEGSFGRGVHRGVDEALSRFLDIVEGRGLGGHGLGGHGLGGHGPGGTGGAGSGGAGDDEAAWRDVYVTLGRGEVRAGRTLDTLLGAYRVGARIAWRRLAVAATEHAGLGTDGLVTLAEMMFAYIDQISAASAQGYAQAQSTAAGERERLRERVAELLLDGGEPAVIRETARAAALRLPDTVAAVLAPASTERALDERLPPGTPTTVRDDGAWAFVPHPDTAAARIPLERALAGLGAVVGPGVAWEDAAASARRAALARTIRGGVRPPTADDPPAADIPLLASDPLFTDDHCLALVLARDPELVGALAARRLAPLADLPAPTRARLAETLLQWLALRGQRGKVAEILRVHPQTVRYRVNQLRGLFGDDLDDPDARFELELVLRAGC